MFRCFRSAQGKVILGLVAMAAIYLVVWHSVHLAAVAPFLLLLACPLMHVLMHRTGHGRHHHSANNDARKERWR